MVKRAASLQWTLTNSRMVAYDDVLGADLVAGCVVLYIHDVNEVASKQANGHGSVRST